MNTPKSKDFGKKIAIIRIEIREKGVGFRIKKERKTSDKAKLLVNSTIERMRKEWQVVSTLTDADIEKWRRDGYDLLRNDDPEMPATLAFQNLIRQKNITDYMRDYQ